MTRGDILKDELARLADLYAKTWQRLPQSLELPEPLPVTSVLRVYESNREKQKETFPIPQTAIHAAIELGAKVVLVEAGPGQGKTSALLWAAHLACLNSLGVEQVAPNGCIPWFKNLGLLIKEGDAQKTLKGILDERPEVMQEKPGLLYLDGLDLLTDSRPDPASLVTAAIRSAEAKGHNYIMSSRPLSGVRGALDSQATSYRIELAGLDPFAVDGWLEKHPGLAPIVEQTCQANASARELRETPLLFAMMVSAAIATEGGQEPLACNQHPGRAGLFAGFINHFLERAKTQKHLGDGYRYNGRVLEGLCWAALTAGHMEEIPDKEYDILLDRALLVPGEEGQPITVHEAASTLASSIDGLHRAGILMAQTDRTIRFIHQEFMEHLGGRHLARRLKADKHDNWLEAELWDHLNYIQLDNLLSHGLAQLEDDQRPAVMSKAFTLLANYNLPERISPLINVDTAIAADIVEPFLKEHSSSIRKYAARALGKIKDPQVVGPLIEALKDQNKDVRESAAKALGDIKDPQAVGPLIEAQRDDHQDVRRNAAEALGKIKIKDPQAVGPLIEALKDQDDFVRWRAVYALGDIKDPQAVGPLIEALKDQNKNVRWSAAGALGDIKDPQAVGPLIEALKDQNKNVRKRAAYALGNIKDPQAVGPLIEALKDKNKDVRENAALALDKIKDPQAVGPLIEALKDQVEDVRERAAYALGNIKDPQAVGPLIEALKDKNKDVRWSAASALGDIKDPQAVGPLIEALKDKNKDVRCRAAYALGNIKDPQAVGPLIEALKDKNKDVRENAALALDKIKDPQAVGPLIEALKDQNKNVRESAAEALGKVWASISLNDPMPELLAHMDQIPDEAKLVITKPWGRRWTDLDNLEKIEGQRLRRLIEEKAMGKNGDIININATNVGQIVGKVEGTNIYNDPQLVLQAVATLRTAFHEGGDILKQGTDRDEALAKLDEIAEAIRSGTDREKIKGPWAWLQNTVNVAVLSDLALKAWEILSKAMAQ